MGYARVVFFFLNHITHNILNEKNHCLLCLFPALPLELQKRLQNQAWCLRAQVGLHNWLDPQPFFWKTLQEGPCLSYGEHACSPRGSPRPGQVRG